MKFKYQAKTKDGEMQMGFVEAGNRESAANILAGHDLFILTIEATETPGILDRFSSMFNRVGRKDMLVFTRQLATLLEARLPLNNALKMLQDQTKGKVLKEAIFQMTEDIDSGLSFSQAMERQGKIFPIFYIEMVRAAEVTGNLNEIAGFLADYTEREGDLASKAGSALIYPAIVIVLFLAVAFILLTFVFPSIGGVFTQNGVALPWYTQMLLNAGNFMARWWMVVIIAIFVSGFVVVDYLTTDEGHAIMDDVKIRFPIAKKVFVPLIMARFGNAAALLVHGGIPIAQSLEIIGHMVGNILYRDVVHDVAEDVRQGKLLSASLAARPNFFPVLVSQMISVGETTGKVEDMFKRLANIYAKETDQVTSNLVDLIQPILMLGMGLMVGLLFASILLPIYNLTANIK
jgi:type IV pilus assembly protein PilC